MRSRATSFLAAGLIPATALASLCFVCGCNDDSHTTGTVATKPPGADEARQKSIENMKNMMKNQPKR